MKNALIIGGSSGIGLDVGKRLAARRIAVTITGRDATKLESAAADIGQAGSPTVTTKAVDLYKRTHVDNFVSELSTGTVFDHLVNSAGYFFPTPFLKHTRENYHQYHDINESLFFITQAVVQRMIDQKIKGSIVNIGSMWARQAIKATPSSAYSMAKVGLHSLGDRRDLGRGRWGDERPQSVMPSVALLEGQAYLFQGDRVKARPLFGQAKRRDCSASQARSVDREVRGEPLTWLYANQEKRAMD